MNKYLKSIITALVCFLIIVILNFILPRMLPGDPVGYLTGIEDELLPAQYDYYYKALHLDKNIFVQFGYYLKSLFNGTLGYTYHLERNVSSVIGERIVNSLQITIPAIILSSGIGLVWGLNSGYKNGGVLDNLSTKAQVLLSTVPSFLIAFILIIILGVNGNLPYNGLNSIGESGFIDRLLHLILPVLTLVIGITPSRYILIRNNTVSVMEEKYVLYAKERGLYDNKIKYNYVLRNILPPFINMTGLSVGACIGGSVVVETIFSINGMGRLLSQSISSLDYPLMQGILFVSSLIMTLSVIACDVICILIDPKRRGGHYE